MLINKTGADHFDFGINNQDFGIENNFVKCVVDGCSEGKNSEVGAKLFCHLLNQQEVINTDTINMIFEKMLNVIGMDARDMRDYLCFTILYVTETENEFIAYTCGDGYIVKQRKEDVIEYEKIDNGKYPIYYVYNFVPKEYLSMYKEGVTFEEHRFSKEEYSAIGVASDGLRYIFGTTIEQEFTDLLLKRKVNFIKRLINKENRKFKDDITLVI